MKSLMTVWETYCEYVKYIYNNKIFRFIPNMIPNDGFECFSLFYLFPFLSIWVIAQPVIIDELRRAHLKTLSSSTEKENFVIAHIS